MSCSTLRKDFPLINRIQGAYLDNAATAHKPQAMLEAMAAFYEHDYATVNRGLYAAGEQATAACEQTRARVAQLINATPHEVIFTSGTTQSINLVASSWALQHCRAGDQIVLTEAEHHANLLPWQEVAAKTGAQLVFIPLDRSSLQLVDATPYITPRTKLVAVTLSSNVLGDVWPAGYLHACIDKAHAVGAVVLLDAAQAIAHQPVDVQALNADFLAFSAHKLFGPTGLGVLFAKQSLQETMQPYQRGGSMVYEAHFDHAVWQKGPAKFEAGTPPIAAIIGFGATLAYLQKTISWPAVQEHETALCRQLLAGLQKLPRVTIVGNPAVIAAHGHLVSFVVAGIHAHDIASALGSQGIAVRAGHLCAQPLVDALGFNSLVRVSVALYSNEQDIALFLQTLEQTIGLFTNILEQP